MLSLEPKKVKKILDPIFRLLRAFAGIEMSKQPILIQRDIYLGIWGHMA